MRIRSASDVAYTSIAWLPLLAIVVAIGWILASGVLGLETVSFGSEFFVKNSETTNLPAQLPSQADALQAALDSGDTDQMSAALDRYEQQQAAAPAAIG
jgi:hypothetical protein